MGYTLQVESTHGLGHPTEWVAPWVRSVPMESLDSPRSDHVTSHKELHGIDHTTWSLMLPLWPFSSMRPNSPHSINETLSLLHSINTQKHTTFGDGWTIHHHSTIFGRSSLTRLHIFGNSWATLDLLHLVLLLTKSSHPTLGFQHCHSAKPVLPTTTTVP